jgi:hypothetical protein
METLVAIFYALLLDAGANHAWATLGAHALAHTIRIVVVVGSISLLLRFVVAPTLLSMVRAVGAAWRGDA